MNSLDTITSTYLKLSKSKNKKDISIFNNLFYHLRPGTYDISVKRQNNKILPRKIDELELILNFTQKINNLLNKSEIKKIDFLLKKNKLDINTYQLINYIIVSIKLRENSKFIFTRSLSDVLEIIKIYIKEKKNKIRGYKQL